MAVHWTRLTMVAAGSLLCSAPALAQTASTPDVDERYVPAPWWMRDPVIAAIGAIHIELPANRASFSATFSEVNSESARALASAAERSAPLDARLQGFGTARVQFTRTFQTRPLYRQYRDGEGNRVENARADQIESYQVTSTIVISIRDVSVIEDVYQAVTAAAPSSVSSISWTLEADDATITALAIGATRDATRRARESAAAAGVRLGAPRIIDPSGSVCATQVLTGWPDYFPGEQSLDASDSENIVMPNIAPGMVSAPPPPPPGSEQVTLRPPMQRLSDTSCVIFALQ